MSVWGELATRYEGKENETHRLLALDGGGIRGILTLEMLQRLQTLLAEATGKGASFRLCDFFDYIGGTSTGAIIAVGLARGMSTQELLEFYEKTGPAMFDKQCILKRWHALYRADPLQAELQHTFGQNTTLEPRHLKCLLLAVTRNRTTDSPWPISSNPQALYNDPSRPDCNLKIPLWRIVRASTAAPVFFPPEVIQWDPADERKAFVFVDGGTTPYNNPAFLLYRMATDPAYRLGWASGERKLLLVSVGSGAAPCVEAEALDPQKGLLENMVELPGALMYGAMVEQDTNCRHLGRCVCGAPIDREIGDMIPRDGRANAISLDADLGRRFLYARYSVELSRQALDAMGLSDIQPSKVQRLDSVRCIGDLRRIGRKAAQQIQLAHFGAFMPQGV